MAQYEVNSPLPGVFYRRAAPDAPSYAQEGDRVEPDTVIGLIEVMKQFSELRAGYAGTLSSFSLADGEPLEPGQLVALIESDS
ncbi:acetyl-CoA carboxylase biotin carboxyl carrier protein subunit [Marinobacterium aestuarii]|uniref:Biotin carboxyl carrier protein of acetyl-CoA carboxylase n=1 Tax=Marinobacterium aestuarii TaxID=1821621 RepID=A0A1A9EV15_9GAMM|nr:acetyl-CoA carboxylase [Marinobacterium aestuarii]ANG61632.1 acetyl-CoA carboxylase biotin carboxyl carrier protein subunit [Marinobacterium aestuarii]